MNILRISKTALPEEALKAFDGFGMMVTCLSPAMMSAMTSMKIARATKKEYFDVVMVDSMDNAMAAVSARQLDKGHDFKLVFCVPPDTDAPKSMPKDIARGVDAWIFPSQRLADLYPDGLNSPTVIQPVSLAGTAITKEAQSAPTIGWIGDIRHSEGLKTALGEVDEQDGRFVLRIAGAGQAKTVMPLVRLSRALVHAGNVVWVGEGYDTAREMCMCDAVLRTAPDITIPETIALQNGIPLISPAEIQAFLSGEATTGPGFDPSPQAFLSSLRNHLLF